MSGKAVVGFLGRGMEECGTMGCGLEVHGMTANGSAGSGAAVHGNQEAGPLELCTTPRSKIS